MSLQTRWHTSRLFPPDRSPLFDRSPPMPMPPRAVPRARFARPFRAGAAAPLPPQHPPRRLPSFPPEQFPLFPDPRFRPVFKKCEEMPQIS